MKALHPAGRLVAGIGLLAAAVVAHDVGIMAAGSLICAVAVRLLSGQWRPVMRALRWLGWLVIPVFLLHMLLTPGALIWPGWPLSVEGVRQGAYLALRLVFLFLAGMTCSRMLSAAEWQVCLLRVPVLGARLYPWLRLLGPMRARTLEIVRRHSRQWRARGARHWPVALKMALIETLLAGREEGRRLWLQWHEPSADADWPGMDARAALVMAAGIALPCLAWLA